MRVALVNGLCVQRDAISEAVRGTARALQEKIGADVRLFAYANDFSEVPFTKVEGARSLLSDQHFLHSDVIIYHFGIYYETFNALIIGNGRAKQIVRFHNVTPKALLPAKSAPDIEKSLRQAASIYFADLALADSATNKSDLISLGVPAGKVEVSPLYVKFEGPPKIRRLDRRTSPVQFLYVGRFVQSKGVLDLVRSLGDMAANASFPFEATLAGNLSFSDAAYLGEVRRLINHLGLADRVRIEGDASDGRLAELYEAADIFVMPSYHEGFCVPVLEALHAGCVPIAYRAGNLPDLIGDMGVLIDPGDLIALANAMRTIGNQIKAGRPATLTLGERSVSNSAYGRQVASYVQSLSFNAFADRMANTVESILRKPGQGEAGGQ